MFRSTGVKGEGEHHDEDEDQEKGEGDHGAPWEEGLMSNAKLLIQHP